MKRVLAVGLAFAFLLWILPLGFFIKPSQEKLACDGQRAMCMCHIGLKVHGLDKSLEPGIVLKSAAPDKEGSGGTGTFLITAKPSLNINLRSSGFLSGPFFSYTNPSLAAVESVPKI